MKNIIALSLIVMVICPASVPAASAQPRQDYAQNQIIVKFRRPVTDTLEMSLADGISASNLKLSASLDRLNKKHRLRKAQPLFKNFRENRKHLNALLQKDKALLTKKEKHILRRLKRAPKGAKVPELDRIYKIDLDLEPGQSLEIKVSDPRMAEELKAWAERSGNHLLGTAGDSECQRIYIERQY